MLLAQEVVGDSPKGLFVDMEPVDGLGPFEARETFPDRHFRGRLTHDGTE